MKLDEKKSCKTVNNKKNLNDEFIEINENKTGLDRQLAEAKFYKKQWINIFKTQTVGTIFGGILFILVLILAPICLCKCFEIWFNLGELGIIVGFAVVIIFGMIFSVVYRAVAVSMVKKDKNATKTVAKVVASSLLSTHFVQSGEDYWGSRKILRTTYKVKLKVQNKTSIAYSKNYYYEQGEEVEVLFNPNRPRHCIILPQK